MISLPSFFLYPCGSGGGWWLVVVVRVVMAIFEQQQQQPFFFAVGLSAVSFALRTPLLCCLQFPHACFLPMLDAAEKECYYIRQPVANITALLLLLIRRCPRLPLLVPNHITACS